MVNDRPKNNRCPKRHSACLANSLFFSLDQNFEAESCEVGIGAALEVLRFDNFRLLFLRLRFWVMLLVFAVDFMKSMMGFLLLIMLAAKDGVFTKNQG